MSIKSKKRINESHNDYRWKRIEEYLVSQGYVLKDSSRDYRVWVDCVSNGRDITYQHSTISDLSSAPVAVFDVICTHSSGRQVWKQVATIKDAVVHSRDNPRW
jgi:hypothetical protein